MTHISALGAVTGLATRSGRFVWMIALATLCAVAIAQSQDSDEKGPPSSSTGPKKKATSKFKDFNEVTEGAERISGLFTLHRKDQHLYAEIPPSQMNKPFLAPMAIARGLASAGTTLNDGDEWVLYFRRVNDNVLLMRQNIHYEAPRGTPLEKAMKQNYTDSVLMSLPILSVKRDAGGEAVLIDFADIFLTDFAELGLGSLDRRRTSWHKIKAFPNNLELEVEATYSAGGRYYGMNYFGDDGVIDKRGITVVIHYSLVRLNEGGYKERRADQRVGYFISATQDFGSKDPDTTFARRINRWRLEKADSKAKLSPPKRQIVWWVEDTVPHEYRPFVEQGILEWNKAFEKIGFLNALDVRWQNERDEFDPEDINYCTFRWITTPSTFAMSTLRSNPMTGEMIDGDVVFDASWIRSWKEEYAMLVGMPTPTGAGQVQGVGPVDVGEIISPIMASKYGYGLPRPLLGANNRAVGEQNAAAGLALVPSTSSPLKMLLSRRTSPGHLSSCQFALGKQHDYKLAAISFAQEEKGDASQLPEEFIGQAIKEVVMHEVGHSLGLRHNFKASTMLSPDEINDVAITRKKGLSGSVMDYNPINIQRKGQKQGDFASTTIGPYDYWAIEYAYKPIDGNEAEELKKIAARSPEADLTYATDEDLYSSNDPHVNTYDLGSDVLRYGKERMALAAELLKDLDSKVVKDGESWARLRSAFSVLLSEYGNAAYLAAAHIGGQSYHRDAKGGEKSRDPIVPVAGPRQREALDFLASEILSDKNFAFSPALLRRLTTEHWYHWGSDFAFSSGTVDYPVFNRILSIQRIVLSECLNANTLRRLQNQQLLSDADHKPLRIEEVFRKISDSVWSELPQAAEGKDQCACSAIRRNLQREHLRMLGQMVVGPSRSPYEDSYGYVMFSSSAAQSYPADARSLACLHLREIQDRIDAVLKQSTMKTDDLTKAHLQDCQALIKRLLDARFADRGP